MYSEFIIALLKLILPKGGMQSFVVSFRFQPTLPFKKVYHKKNYQDKNTRKYFIIQN